MSVVPAPPNFPPSPPLLPRPCPLNPPPFFCVFLRKWISVGSHEPTKCLAFIKCDMVNPTPYSLPLAPTTYPCYAHLPTPLCCPVSRLFVHVGVNKYETKSGGRRRPVYKSSRQKTNTKSAT